MRAGAREDLEKSQLSMYGNYPITRRLLSKHVSFWLFSIFVSTIENEKEPCIRISLLLLFFLFFHPKPGTINMHRTALSDIYIYIYIFKSFQSWFEPYNNSKCFTSVKKERFEIFEFFFNFEQ